MNFERMINSTLSGLGWTLIWNGKFAEGCGCEIFLSLLDIFPAVALYLLGQGETHFALELYTLASRYAYVANSRWIEDVAGRHIEAVKASLTADEVARAERQGKARDMWATATELVALLEKG
jgi:hypothetical protein